MHKTSQPFEKIGCFPAVGMSQIYKLKNRQKFIRWDGSGTHTFEEPKDTWLFSWTIILNSKIFWLFSSHCRFRLVVTNTTKKWMSSLIGWYLPAYYLTSLADQRFFKIWPIPPYSTSDPAMNFSAWHAFSFFHSEAEKGVIDYTSEKIDKETKWFRRKAALKQYAGFLSFTVYQVRNLAFLRKVTFDK